MEDQVVFITGASRGIGLAIAKRFAEASASVIICSRMAPEGNLPDNIRHIICDVSDKDNVHEALSGLPRLDVLVNNAGIGGQSTLDDAGDRLWDDVMRVNLTGTYHCCRAAIPLLKKSRAGRIINISSVLGLRGASDSAAYCASKHGVIGLTRALALLLAENSITVNAICPGWVGTELAAQRFAQLGLAESDVAARVPTGRITTPGEIAAAVSWLASADAGNITGQIIAIDGGALAMI